MLGAQRGLGQHRRFLEEGDTPLGRELHQPRSSGEGDAVHAPAMVQVPRESLAKIAECTPELLKYVRAWTHWSNSFVILDRVEHNLRVQVSNDDDDRAALLTRVRDDLDHAQASTDDSEVAPNHAEYQQHWTSAIDMVEAQFPTDLKTLIRDLSKEVNFLRRSAKLAVDHCQGRAMKHVEQAMKAISEIEAVLKHGLDRADRGLVQPQGIDDRFETADRPLTSGSVRIFTPTAAAIVHQKEMR